MKTKIDLSISACAIALALASCGGGGSSLATGDVYVPFKAQSGDRYGMISTDGKVLFEDEFDNEPSVALGGVFSVVGSDGKLKYYTADAKPAQVGKDSYTQGGYCDGSVIPVVKEGGPVILVDKTGAPVGMGVIIPSIAEPLIKGRGRMTPLTILRLLRAIKKPRELEMALVAVRPDYQKKGVNSLMMARISSHIIEDKIRRVESNPELVTNLAVQTQWTSFEREIIKRRKTFVKKID